MNLTISQQPVSTDGRRGRTQGRPLLVVGLTFAGIAALAALAWPLLETAFVRGYVEYFFVQLLYQLGCY